MIKRIRHNNYRLPIVAKFGNFILRSDDESLDLNVDDVVIEPVINNKIDDDCITEFLSSDLLKVLIKNKNVIAILLTGSRSIGLVDSMSDYDINIIIDDGDNDVVENVRYRTNASWNDKFIHWFYNPYAACKHIREEIEQRDLYFYQRNTTPIILQIYDIEKFNAIYENGAFDALAREANIKLCNILWDDTVLPIVKNNSVDINDVVLYPKSLYNLCIISHDFEQTPYDYDHIIQIKHIDQLHDGFIATDEDRKYCVDRVIFLYKYFIKNNLLFKENFPLRGYEIC